MIELKLKIDQIDYDELLNAIIPHLVKNKFAEKTLKTAISARFSLMDEAEKNSAAISFINDNSSKITDMINEYITQQISGCHISSLEAIK